MSSSSEPTEVRDTHWETITKMYNCPECGYWVTKCDSNCPITDLTQSF